MSITKLKKSVGITLIELMIALTISFVILSALFTIYRSQLQSVELQAALHDIQFNAKSAINAFTADLHDKTQIDYPSFILNIYTIEKTQKKYKDGVPIYALFKRIKTQKIKIANNVDHLIFRFTVIDEGERMDKLPQQIDDWSKVLGVAIEFDVMSSAIKKHWYAYIAL